MKKIKKKKLIVKKIKKQKTPIVIQKFKEFIKSKIFHKFKNFKYFSNLKAFNKFKKFRKLKKIRVFKETPLLLTLNLYKNGLNKKYIKKVLSSARVTKVTPGFRKFTMRILLAMGNKVGAVGIGVGRGARPDIATVKATNEAEKSIIYIPRTTFFSIPCRVENKVVTSSIKLYPTSNKAGLMIGGSPRTIVELAGIKNIMGIQIGSRNILNSSYATINALSSLKLKIAFFSKMYLKNKIYFKNVLLHEAPIHL